MTRGDWAGLILISVVSVFALSKGTFQVLWDVEIGVVHPWRLLLVGGVDMLALLFLVACWRVALVDKQKPNVPFLS